MNSRERILKEEEEYVHQVFGNGLDEEKMKELHNKIISGEISIGPITTHDEPVADLRPKYTGEEAWIWYKAKTNGDHFNIGDLPELRRLLDST